MSKSAKSLVVFAIYLFLLGSLLILVPNLVLSVFRIPETVEVWIRVVGTLVTILGYYYLQAARNNLITFFKTTVYGRFSVLVFFIAFVVFKLAPPVLILFGGIDAAGAVWTASYLRAENTA